MLDPKLTCLHDFWHFCKKKLAISLSLIGSPKILLLDEPFAALDILSISNLQQIIVGLQTRSNITVIVCDHQARDLLSCVDVVPIVVSVPKQITCLSSPETNIKRDFVGAALTLVVDATLLDNPAEVSQ